MLWDVSQNIFQSVLYLTMSWDILIYFILDYILGYSIFYTLQCMGIFQYILYLIISRDILYSILDNVLGYINIFLLDNILGCFNLFYT